MHRRSDELWPLGGAGARGRAALAALAALAAGMGASGAEAAPPPAALALEWSAPADCPAQAAVFAEVKRLLRRDPRVGDDRLTARVLLRRVGDRWEMRVRTWSGTTVGERVLEGRSCAVLAEAAALILAMTLDPAAVLARASDGESAGARLAPPAVRTAGTALPARAVAEKPPPPPVPPPRLSIVMPPARVTVTAPSRSAPEPGPVPSPATAAPAPAPGPKPTAPPLASSPEVAAAALAPVAPVTGPGPLPSARTASPAARAPAPVAPPPAPSGPERTSPAPPAPEASIDDDEDGWLDPDPPRPARVAPVPEEPAPVLVASAERPRIRLFARAALAGDAGSLPSASGGPALTAGLTVGHFRAELGWTYWARRPGYIPGSTEAGGRFDLWAFGLRACGLLPLRPVELSGCAGAEAGRLHGRSFGGLAREEAGHSPWVGAAISAAASREVAPGVALYIDLGLVVPLVRPTFVLDNPRRELHQPAAAVGRGSIGAEVRFF